MQVQPADASPVEFPRDTHPIGNRTLAIATAIVFCISSTFPAVAGFVKDTDAWPKWWGVLDVVFAFLLAGLSILLLGSARGKVSTQAEDATYRVYRNLIHGFLVIPVVYIVVGDRIIWTQCLTGFAWRTWLLLYCLPTWLEIFSTVENPARVDSFAPQRKRN